MLDQQLPLRRGLCAADRALCTAGLAYGAVLRAWGREVGETDLARKRKMICLAALRVPSRGWHVLCMPRSVLTSFDSIVYFVGGVITGWGGEPQLPQVGRVK